MGKAVIGYIDVIEHLLGFQSYAKERMELWKCHQMKWHFEKNNLIQVFTLACFFFLFDSCVAYWQIKNTFAE